MPIDPTSTPIAHGDRRDAHFEDAPDHLVRVSHLVKPSHPLPKDVTRSGPDTEATQGSTTPTQDVAVAPDTPSVWDASPPELP